MPRDVQRKTWHSQAGMTYLEVLLAAAILAGGVLSSALAFESVVFNKADGELGGIGQALVADGLAVARRYPRTDPESPGGFGKESGEAADFVDDVDDLDGVVETAVVDLGGEEFAGWQRTWSIDTVSIGDPALVAADGSTNLLRVTVTVTHISGEACSAVDLLYLP